MLVTKYTNPYILNSSKYDVLPDTEDTLGIRNSMKVLLLQRYKGRDTIKNLTESGLVCAASIDQVEQVKREGVYFAPLWQTIEHP